MGDPYQCLRCSSICIGAYNIIYCLIQYGVLGWQVGVVKERQWEFENRLLPATGHNADGFQARFPGLYAIYTETPERRRVNGEPSSYFSRLWSFGILDRFRRRESSAMFAIVLICLFLCIVHFFTTTLMIYGAVKRRPQMILPFFFTGVPTVVMCTAYSVLWWSGDIFNEQLTMSVTEFVLSLAINAVCMVIVMFYYYRLTGQLSSDVPRKKPPFHTNLQRYPSNAHRVAYEPGVVPPWRTEWPREPPWQLERKLRRREWLGTPARSILGNRPASQAHRRSTEDLVRAGGGTLPRSATRRTRSSSSPLHASPQTPPPPTEPQRTQRQPQQPLQSVQRYEESPRRPRKRSSSRRRRRNSERRRAPPAEETFRRKSPQRVSFNSRPPRVYERTPESSLSGRPEVHTVV